MTRLLSFACLFFLLLAPARAAAQDAETRGAVARVGVLAHRGMEGFEPAWRPLRDYLDAAVPGWTFRFSPVTLSSARGLLENGELDFLITNPGHFAVLNDDFPMSVLATRSRILASGETLSEFGSVIFTRADSGITEIGQSRGASVMAVDSEAFGGFQLARSEFVHQGIDPFSDFSRIGFVGFPQDQIVTRVLAGEADIGIVRSGLLEAMAREGRVELAALRVLNDNVSFTHPQLISTRLYPEWPFLALAGTEAGLRNAVAIALLQTHDGAVRAAYGLGNGWVAPVPYHAVRELLASFDTADQTRFSGFAAPVWALFGAMVLLIAVLALRRRPVRAQAPEPVEVEVAATESGGAEHEPLTPREQEILDFISDGCSTKEIAARLDISPKTVEFHRSNLLRKYGARSSLELVKLAS